LLSVFGIVSGQIDIILLGILSTPHEIAIYKIGFTWAALLTFAMTAIDVVLFPKISLLYKNNEKEKLNAILKNAAKISFSFSIALFAVFLIFGEIIIMKLYGNDYKDAAKIVQILCLGQLVNTFVGSVHGVLNLTGFEKVITKISIIFAVLGCLLHFYSALNYGAIGVAISAALLICGINISLLYCVKIKTGLNTTAIP
jgi:O-antigen/teichoic acid export membrane protein